MEIIDQTTTDGVVRRRFDLAVEGQTVPGLHWWPEATGSAGVKATILIGHGGFQSKEAPNIVEMAEQLAVERNYATIALDAPGHGERRTEEQIAQQDATLRRLRSGGVDDEMRRARDRAVGATAPAGDTDARRGGSGDPGTGASTGTSTGGSGEARPERDPARPPRMVREWKALLDHLDADPDAPGGPYGYWGVSMGARFGIPLVASEPRIRCAVLGLFGLLPDPAFQATVESITVPLLFLFQYHDELMTPEAGLALFAAFGSKEKTMHINPGPHVGIPRFERDASATFFARHLDA